MKRVWLISVATMMLTLCSGAVNAQPMQADQPTEAVGRVCRTMEQHPAPTAEVNYAVLDYALCGPGGLRVYPLPQTASAFNKISMGTQGTKAGKDVVYLHGYMRTKVMPAFGTPGTPSWRPRFRFSWLEVDQIRRGISILGKPHVKREGNAWRISIDLTNPFNKPIQGTEAILKLRGSQYLQPFRKMVPVLRAGAHETVTFDVLAGGGKPKGTIQIKNYGRLYIDLEADL